MHFARLDESKEPVVVYKYLVPTGLKERSDDAIFRSLFLLQRAFPSPRLSLMKPSPA